MKQISMTGREGNLKAKTKRRKSYKGEIWSIEKERENRILLDLIILSVQTKQILTIEIQSAKMLYKMAIEILQMEKRLIETTIVMM